MLGSATHGKDPEALNACHRGEGRHFSIYGQPAPRIGPKCRSRPGLGEQLSPSAEVAAAHPVSSAGDEKYPCAQSLWGYESQRVLALTDSTVRNCLPTDPVPAPMVNAMGRPL